MTATLRCEGIRKAYGGVGVLHGIDLAIGAGDILGLVGANGAGKTTLIDIIGGQQTANAGTVWLGAERLVGKPSERAQRGMARTFQRPQVALELTLRENVAIGLAARELTSLPRILAHAWRGIVAGTLSEGGAVETICRRLALQGLDRLAGEVTFGELRLVEVGRALLQHPKFIVLDEPFSGVGDAGIAGIIGALQAIREEGCAVLLIDHNVDLLTKVVDRMALLAQGEIVVDADVPTCLASERFRSTYIGAV
jgi:branched-chain amino acid transport system ATP-binding protein